MSRALYIIVILFCSDRQVHSWSKMLVLKTLGQFYYSKRFNQFAKLLSFVLNGSHFLEIEGSAACNSTKLSIF